MGLLLSLRFLTFGMRRAVIGHVHRAKERKSPSPQYIALAQDIVSATYYGGPSFSPGDQQINDVAKRFAGPGNATTHLRAATSRHLHLVLSRLASLGAP